jgi:hypothetical protein
MLPFFKENEEEVERWQGLDPVLILIKFNINALFILNTPKNKMRSTIEFVN